MDRKRITAETYGKEEVVKCYVFFRSSCELDVLGNFCMRKICSAFFASRICVFSSINHQCNLILLFSDFISLFPPGLRSHLFQV